MAVTSFPPPAGSGDEASLAAAVGKFDANEVSASTGTALLRGSTTTEGRDWRG